MAASLLVLGPVPASATTGIVPNMKSISWQCLGNFKNYGDSRGVERDENIILVMTMFTIVTMNDGEPSTDGIELYSVGVMCGAPYLLLM